MRVVVALGGNALLRRHQPLTAENQRENVRIACEALAPIAVEHELVISHGNGPQVGLLALQGSAYGEVETYPLDVLDAQTEGMIGYLIEQELGNLLPGGDPDRNPADHGRGRPRRSRVRPPNQADRSGLRSRAGGPTGARRAGHFDPMATASAGRPFAPPDASSASRPIEWLIERGCVVICAGGGGIPTMYSGEPAPAGRRLIGVEGVIDKDHASARLAADINADALVIATDVDAVYLDWGHRTSGRSDAPPPKRSLTWRSPKARWAPRCRRPAPSLESGQFAAIGQLADVGALLRGETGTIVSLDADGVEFDPHPTASRSSVT